MPVDVLCRVLVTAHVSYSFASKLMWILSDDFKLSCSSPSQRLCPLSLLKSDLLSLQTPIQVIQVGIKVCTITTCTTWSCWLILHSPPKRPSVLHLYSIYFLPSIWFLPEVASSMSSSETFIQAALLNSMSDQCHFHTPISNSPAWAIPCTCPMHSLSSLLTSGSHSRSCSPVHAIWA